MYIQYHINVEAIRNDDLQTIKNNYIFFQSTELAVTSGIFSFIIFQSNLFIFLKIRSDQREL